MIIRTLDDVTADALAAMSRTENPRLREIMTSLVKHLHAFVREVRLTEPEFRQAAAILNEMGKLSSDSHNEPGSKPIDRQRCHMRTPDPRRCEFRPEGHQQQHPQVIDLVGKPAERGSGATTASAPKPVTSLRLSTAGLSRASTRSI